MASPPSTASRQLQDGVLAALLVAGVWALPDALYEAFLTEDGPLEWLQVAALAVVAGAAVRAARAAASPAGAAAFAVVAIGTVVAIGEELAWGTRLFDVSVATIQDANAQGEVTLHNLPGVRGLSKTFAAMATLGSVGALLVVRRRPGLAVWFAAPAVYCVARLVHDGAITYRFAKLSEVLELLLYLALARVAVAPPAGARPALPIAVRVEPVGTPEHA